MAFHVGQRVVCVDASPHKGTWARHLPPYVKGQQYTVTDVWLDKDDWYGDICVDGETHYTSAWRFRPITETKTDISIFTAMLGPKQRETIDG